MAAWTAFFTGLFVPAHVDMAEFSNFPIPVGKSFTTEEVLANTCNSTLCMSGWLVLRHNENRELHDQLRNPACGIYVFKHLKEAGRLAIDFLFYMHNWPDQQYDAYTSAQANNNPAGMVEAACSLLDMVIAGKDINIGHNQLFCEPVR